MQITPDWVLDVLGYKSPFGSQLGMIHVYFILQSIQSLTPLPPFSFLPLVLSRPHFSQTPSGTSKSHDRQKNYCPWLYKSKRYSSKNVTRNYELICVFTHLGTYQFLSSIPEPVLYTGHAPEHKPTPALGDVTFIDYKDINGLRPKNKGKTHVCIMRTPPHMHTCIIILD